MLNAALAEIGRLRRIVAAAAGAPPPEPVTQESWRHEMEQRGKLVRKLIGEIIASGQAAGYQSTGDRS